MNKKIGIITVFYKSDKVLPAFINCMNRQTHKNFEIIFIENDPENTFSENYVKENAAFGYHYVKNKLNSGIAAANNQGIDYFKGENDTNFLLFLNNDIEVDDDFFEKQIVIFEKNTFVDALAPKMFYYNSGNKIWYAGGDLSLLKGGAIHYGHNKKDKLTGKELFKVSYAPTCSVMIRTQLLLESNIRMWENLFVYYDDVVFAKELKQKGMQLYYTPTIRLQHKIGISSGGAKSEFSRYYHARNWTYMARSFKTIGLLYIPAWMLLNLLTGKKLENRAIIDAFKMA